MALIASHIGLNLYLRTTINNCFKIENGGIYRACPPLAGSSLPYGLVASLVKRGYLYTLYTLDASYGVPHARHEFHTD